MDSTGIRRMLHIEVVDRSIDFPRGFPNPTGGANLLFGMIFAEDCMKMKNIGMAGCGWVGEHPPRSAIAMVGPNTIDMFTEGVPDLRILMVDYFCFQG